nr:hypothetical protein [Paracoccus sp. (in: a-proteobacteria)]
MRPKTRSWPPAALSEGYARGHDLSAALIPDDYGTEITSKAFLQWANGNGVEWHCIDPGKPVQNGFVVTSARGFGAAVS